MDDIINDLNIFLLYIWPNEGNNNISLELKAAENKGMELKNIAVLGSSILTGRESLLDAAISNVANTATAVGSWVTYGSVLIIKGAFESA